MLAAAAAPHHHCYCSSASSPLHVAATPPHHLRNFTAAPLPPLPLRLQTPPIGTPTSNTPPHTIRWKAFTVRHRWSHPSVTTSGFHITAADDNTAAASPRRRSLTTLPLSTTDATQQQQPAVDQTKLSVGDRKSQTTSRSAGNPTKQGQNREFDLRYAFPLGFYHAALNFGVSTGVIFPWGSGFLSKPSYLPERFFLGGNSSPVCTLGGPTTLLGFKSRGLGPTEPRRQIRTNSNGESSDTDSGRDYVGGDLALTAFADLSFDLPLRVFREAGIHGHFFACAGNVTKLTENAYREFSFQKFRESFRSSAGAGIIVPTRLFRMEVNYCYVLKQLEHDRGKTGVQFSFSSPL
ncbi:hypothetical protein RHGRI_008057 [Rhododendron griersonianum]|uniref:Bacterial surface antigen (D15) domain-containing protein n=1 Tax=Rhododendron griersonianum TaxID=479676 RepID=A0AAV6KZG6_9ERIC|nr:hypothetical protein RHGRI_008057 [Rhododendron griersonianum]